MLRVATVVAMGLLRALGWVLVTGRDRDMGPPLKWWRGPAWVKWVILLGFLSWWGMSGFVVWAWAANHDGVMSAVLVLAQVSAPLLTGYRPLTAVRITMAGAILAMAVVHPIPFPIAVVHSWPLDAYLIPFAPVVTMAIARSPKNKTLGLAISVVGVVVVGTTLLGRTYGASVVPGPFVGVVFAVVIGYVLADSRRARQASVEEREKRSTLEERNRIARELHDVIGHHLSMIAVRTDSAPYRLTGLDGPARDEFAALGTAAREALHEARQLIGVLREEGAEAEHMPQPTIEDIPDLVNQSASSGATVRLAVDGLADGVPAVVGLAAYRIVQESLSNALRHSPGAPVDVRMRYTPEGIELSVDNGPSGARPDKGEGSGLAGIRERVGLVGGSCTIGPRSDGGFQVWARLPR